MNLCEDTTRPPTSQENQLRRLMQVWMILFGIGALAFLFGGDQILKNGNRIGDLFGMTPMPMPTERFWLSLTVSMMVTITALSFYIQRDVVVNKKITSFLLISKLTSTLVFLFFFFADHPYFNYLLGSVFCDGPIFLITFIFYRRALLSKPPCPNLP